MNVQPASIRDVLVLVPEVFTDDRGYFSETYNLRRMESLGIPDRFVQDNVSVSRKNVLRGLHYQIQNPQGKLVRVTKGAVFDVAVDMRKQSATFGQHVSLTLSADSRQMVWLPPGFAHGFLVLSELAEVSYKTTDYYNPQAERTVLWNDPNLAIRWPVAPAELIISPKDARGVAFRNAEYF